MGYGVGLSNSLLSFEKVDHDLAITLALRKQLKLCPQPFVHLNIKENVYAASMANCRNFANPISSSPVEPLAITGQRR